MYNTAVTVKDLGEPGSAPDALGQSCKFTAGQQYLDCLEELQYSRPCATAHRTATARSHWDGHANEILLMPAI